jgi:hypothetical protein
MGRTNDGLPPRSKSEREFDHEIGNIVFVLSALPQTTRADYARSSSSPLPPSPPA